MRCNETVSPHTTPPGSHLRFRRVEGIGRVSDVLSAVENTKSKSGQEISRCQVAGNGTEAEPGPAFKKHINILQLRYVVLSVAAVFDQIRPVLLVFSARVHGVQFVKFVEDGAPAGVQKFKCKTTLLLNNRRTIGWFTLFFFTTRKQVTMF